MRAEQRWLSVASEEDECEEKGWESGSWIPPRQESNKAEATFRATLHGVVGDRRPRLFCPSQRESRAALREARPCWGWREAGELDVACRPTRVGVACRFARVWVGQVTEPEPEPEPDR